MDVDLATSTPSAPSVASSRASGADGDTSADAPESSPRGSNAESTISALDALLGVDADPEPDVAPARARPRVSLPRDRLLLPAETSVTRSRAESLGAVRGALTDEPAPSTPSRRSDPLDAYDPEFDPLGLGPRWDVPWSWPTLALTLVAVEASFYFAGALAPAIVYSSVREPDEMPLDDPAAFARDVQFVFDDPTSFADIVVCAEVVQTALALDSSPPSAASRARYPPGGSNSQSRATYHPKNSSGEGVTGSRTRKRREETNAETRGRLSGFDSILGIRLGNADVVARRCPRCAGVRWIGSARRRARQR